MFKVQSDLTLKNGKMALDSWDIFKPGKRIEFDSDNGNYDDDITNLSAFGIITQVKVVFYADKPAEVLYDVKMDNGHMYEGVRSYAVRGFADIKRK